MGDSKALCLWRCVSTYKEQFFYFRDSMLTKGDCSLLLYFIQVLKICKNLRFQTFIIHLLKYPSILGNISDINKNPYQNKFCFFSNLLVFHAKHYFVRKHFSLTMQNLRNRSICIFCWVYLFVVHKKWLFRCLKVFTKIY